MGTPVAARVGTDIGVAVASGVAVGAGVPGASGVVVGGGVTVASGVAGEVGVGSRGIVAVAPSPHACQITANNANIPRMSRCLRTIPSLLK